MTHDTLEVLRDVGHRLRTPLATIHGYASLVEAHARDPLVLPSDLAVWARRIQLETDRLNGLLLDLSRLRGLSAATLRLAPLDLRALVDESVRQAEDDLDQTLALEPGEPVSYQGDAALLRRVTYHLALLGLQHRPEARLRLTASPSGPRLELRLADGWAPPDHDPWLTFCSAVAEAHGGCLKHGPTGPTLCLGQAGHVPDPATTCPGGPA